jgi:cytochrome oxidase Cu insertion factor (SCO1/SenC/PrrC family)
MIMRQHPDRRQKLVFAALVVSSAFVLFVGTAWGVRAYVTAHNQAAIQASANAIGGFPLTGTPAPDFNLTNQFGQSVSLSSLRGHEIVLAFIDSQCKTLCPLTATIMYDAKMKLGSAAANISLVAVNANPAATSVAAVQAWSIEHGMLHQWLFLTGPAQQLQTIYHQYGVYDQVASNGQDVHDPVTFIIDPTGHERLYFETLDSSSKLDLSDQEIGLEAGMRQWLP